MNEANEYQLFQENKYTNTDPSLSLLKSEPTCTQTRERIPENDNKDFTDLTIYRG